MHTLINLKLESQEVNGKVNLFKGLQKLNSLSEIFFPRKVESFDVYSRPGWFPCYVQR